MSEKKRTEAHSFEGRAATSVESYSQTGREPAPEPLLTVTELAARLNVSRGWLYRRTELNDIPHERLGKHIRFDWNAINEWRESRRVGQR